MNRTQKIAQTGVLSALACVIMTMGGLIPFATFCCPALAGIVLIPIFVECGEKTAWAAWFVISALTVFISPEKESAFLFLFIGYYPILRWRLEQIHSSALRLLSKLAVFNIAVGSMYALCIFVFRLDAFMREYAEAGLIMTALTFLLGNFVILVYDLLLNNLTTIYVRKLRNKLLKK